MEWNTRILGSFWSITRGIPDTGTPPPPPPPPPPSLIQSDRHWTPSALSPSLGPAQVSPLVGGLSDRMVDNLTLDLDTGTPAPLSSSSSGAHQMDDTMYSDENDDGNVVEDGHVEFRRSFHASALVDQKYMFVFGGLVRNRQGGSSSSSSSNSGRSLKRRMSGKTTVNSHSGVGGVPSLVPTNSFFQYNIDTGEVQVLPTVLSNPTPQETHVPPLSHHTMSLLQGTERDPQASYLYVFGGKTSDGKPSDRMYRFDLREFTWTRIDYNTPLSGSRIFAHTLTHVDGSELPERTAGGSGAVPCARFSHASVVIDSTKIFLFGGETTQQCLDQQRQQQQHQQMGPIKKGIDPNSDSPVYLNDLYIFHTETNQWTKVMQDRKEMSYHHDNQSKKKGVEHEKKKKHERLLVPEPRCGHSWALYGTDIYLFGGGNNETMFNDLYALSTETLTWRKVEVSTSSSSSSSSSSSKKKQPSKSSSGGKSGRKKLSVSTVVEPTMRMFHTCNVVGDKMIIFGGIGARKDQCKIENQGDLMVFCLDKRVWNANPLKNPPLAQTSKSSGAARSEKQESRKLPSASVLYPPCFYGHSSVANNGRLWVFGGQYRHGSTSIVVSSAASASTNANSSTSFSDLSTPRTPYSALSLRHPSDTQFVFDEQQNVQFTWPDRSTVGDVDHFASDRVLFTLDTNIRVRQPIVVYRSTLAEDLGTLIECNVPIDPMIEEMQQFKFGDQDEPDHQETAKNVDWVDPWDISNFSHFQFSVIAEYKHDAQIDESQFEIDDDNNNMGTNFIYDIYIDDQGNEVYYYRSHEHELQLGRIVSDLVLQSQHISSSSSEDITVDSYFVHMVIIRARCSTLYRKILDQLRTQSSADTGSASIVEGEKHIAAVSMNDIVQSLWTRNQKKDSRRARSDSLPHQQMPFKAQRKPRQQRHLDEYEKYRIDEPISSGCMLALLEFIYTDQVHNIQTLSFEDAQQLSFVANLLQLTRLFNICHAHSILTRIPRSDDGNDEIVDLHIPIPPPTIFDDMKSLWYQTFQYSRQATLSATKNIPSLDDRLPGSVHGSVYTFDEHGSRRSSLSFTSESASASLLSTDTNPALSQAMDDLELTSDEEGIIGETEYHHHDDQHVLELRKSSGSDAMSQSNAQSSGKLSSMDMVSDGMSAVELAGENPSEESEEKPSDELSELELAAQRIHCDVLFLVEHERIYAHRCILISRSHKFSMMLLYDQQDADSFNVQRSAMADDEIQEISITDVRPQVFKLMLEFMYTGSCDDIGFDYALELLIASEVYNLPRLSLICQQLIERKMHVHNASRILSISHDLGISALRGSSASFIIMHYNQVRRTAGYREELNRELKIELKRRRKLYKDEINGKLDSTQHWMDDIESSMNDAWIAPPVVSQHAARGMTMPFAPHVTQGTDYTTASSPPMSASPMRSDAFFASKYSKRMKHREREKRKKTGRRKSRRDSDSFDSSHIEDYESYSNTDLMTDEVTEVQELDKEGEEDEQDEDERRAERRRRRRQRRRERSMQNDQEESTETESITSGRSKRREKRRSRSSRGMRSPSPKRKSGSAKQSRSKSKSSNKEAVRAGKGAKKLAIVHAVDSPVGKRSSRGYGLPRKGSQHFDVSTEELESEEILYPEAEITEAERLEMEHARQHIYLQSLQYGDSVSEVGAPLASSGIVDQVEERTQNDDSDRGTVDTAGYVEDDEHDLLDNVFGYGDDDDDEALDVRKDIELILQLNRRSKTLPSSSGIVQALSSTFGTSERREKQRHKKKGKGTLRSLFGGLLGEQ